MLIRFKNKNTAAIISMIEKGKSHGGLPSCIEVTVDEAQSIIDEINSLRDLKDTQHNRFKFSRGVVDSRLSFIGKDLSDDERFELLTDWTKQLIEVTFDGIPLKVTMEEIKGHSF